MTNHAEHKHAIAVLDDRPDQRQTLVRSIRAHLPPDWRCIPSPLLPTPSAYVAWLQENNVRVLVADQVLNEHSTKPSEAIDYKGNQVTDAIRKNLPNFPVYIVTAHPGDSDLPGMEPEVEAVLNRRQLTEKALVHVPRMLRAGMRYHEDQVNKLKQLSELAAKVAAGRATRTDEREMKKIQAEFGALSSIQMVGERATLLADAEKEIDALKSLRQKIEAIVGARSHEMDEGRHTKKTAKKG